MTEIGEPLENPDKIVYPIHDPVPRRNPTPLPKEPTPAPVEPVPEKVPA